jgi:TPR repeat protein
MKRVEMNDPVAMCREGGEQYTKGNYSTAFEYLTKAAGLGDIKSHYQLSCLYHEGEGVEKDEKNELYHLEEATVGGHPMARNNLGAVEARNGRNEKAVKHLIIAVNLGDDLALEALVENYKRGFIEKDDLAAALRAHKAAVDATKSPQREAAQEYRRNNQDE